VARRFVVRAPWITRPAHPALWAESGRATCAQYQSLLVQPGLSAGESMNSVFAAKWLNMAP